MDLTTPYVFTLNFTCFTLKSVFTRSQDPTQLFKEPSINPSRIQHQSERCNGSKLNSGGQGKENSKTKLRKLEDILKSTKIKKWLNQIE